MTSDISALAWIAVLFVTAFILGILNISQAMKAKRAEKEEEELEEERERRIRTYYIPKFIEALKEADTLSEVFVLHMKIWGAGIRPHNIGPDRYGMYRTNDILTMTPDEVYLGAICGLNTHSLSYWEKYSESDPTAYKQVLCQYKSQLLCNLKAYHS